MKNTCKKRLVERGAFAVVAIGAAGVGGGGGIVVIVGVFGPGGVLVLYLIADAIQCFPQLFVRTHADAHFAHAYLVGVFATGTAHIGQESGEVLQADAIACLEEGYHGIDQRAYGGLELMLVYTGLQRHLVGDVVNLVDGTAVYAAYVHFLFVCAKTYVHLRHLY